MEKIESFKIDHTRLQKGLYVSRKDSPNKNCHVTTFDIRMAAPYKDNPISGATLHTIEHLAATYLRNDDAWKEFVLYWGPMGCRTGCYLVLYGDFDVNDIVPLMKRMFSYISEFTGQIPGASEKECGNANYNDLKGAKLVASKYLDEVLNNLTQQNTVYPA